VVAVVRVTKTKTGILISASPQTQVKMVEKVRQRLCEKGLANDTTTSVSASVMISAEIPEDRIEEAMHQVAQVIRDLGYPCKLDIKH
jgi:hypothetical protein